MKKSFLKNILELMHVNKTSISNDINAKEADNLQLSYIDSVENASKIDNYPPYIDIASQLFSEKNEVFYAAVYYLVKIAENESNYAEQIKNILQQYKEQATRSEEEMKFLQSQIDNIEQNFMSVI